MISRFNHHLFVRKQMVIKFAGHLSETFFNHHLLITMGPLPKSGSTLMSLIIALVFDDCFQTGGLSPDVGTYVLGRFP